MHSKINTLKRLSMSIKNSLDQENFFFHYEMFKLQRKNYTHLIYV